MYKLTKLQSYIQFIAGAVSPSLERRNTYVSVASLGARSHPALWHAANHNNWKKTGQTEYFEYKNMAVV